MTVKQSADTAPPALLTSFLIVAALLLSACSQPGTVVVTVTTTPGKVVTVPGGARLGSGGRDRYSATVAKAPAAKTTVTSSVAPMRYQTEPTFGTKNLSPDPAVHHDRLLRDLVRRSR